MFHNPHVSPYGNPIELQQEFLYKSFRIPSIPLESSQRSSQNPNINPFEYIGGPYRHSYRTNVFEWQVNVVGFCKENYVGHGHRIQDMTSSSESRPGSVDHGRLIFPTGNPLESL